jgi:phosphopantothenoylcysteine decarboxylase / phosphopantothenate---cysteine ligase
MLQGKKILVGVTAGIAAYKIPFLVRLLKKCGAEVKVIMTDAAVDFVTPLTLSVVSQNPVHRTPFDLQSGSWNSHIEIGSWADAFVIAPLTANTMAKMANGLTDNLLTAVYLAARCPVFIAPAMDVDMYLHPATQMNLAQLQKFGNIVIPPTEGELASGLNGPGRMEEPEKIVEILENYFAQSADLNKKKILITAGPTREKLDPVRFISNFSTGKMGIALAQEAAKRGAEVFLVHGPISTSISDTSIKTYEVESAEEMYSQCIKLFPLCNAAILTAAVADYKPAETSLTKIKKDSSDPVLHLTRTKDILEALGQIKAENQILVGFALETDNEEINAKKKLHTKNLDFIVLNSLRDAGAGFGTHTNKVTVFKADGSVITSDLKQKNEVASDIIDHLCLGLNAKAK